MIEDLHATQFVSETLNEANYTPEALGFIYLHCQVVISNGIKISQILPNCLLLHSEERLLAIIPQLAHNNLLSFLVM